MPSLSVPLITSSRNRGGHGSPERAQIPHQSLASPDWESPVTHTSTAGQPTLTLADSWALLDKRLVESLVVNASTGSPVALFNRQPGQPLDATYYHTSRVTLADGESGKF